MLSNLLAMLKERFWKDKRRGSPKPHQSSVVSPYLDLAVTSEDIWFVEGELQAMEKTIVRRLLFACQHNNNNARARTRGIILLKESV